MLALDQNEEPLSSPNLASSIMPMRRSEKQFEDDGFLNNFRMK